MIFSSVEFLFNSIVEHVLHFIFCALDSALNNQYDISMKVQNLPT